jgi:hypothetical protein
MNEKRKCSCGAEFLVAWPPADVYNAMYKGRIFITTYCCTKDEADQVTNCPACERKQKEAAELEAIGDRCCQPMREALLDGSDAEGYGPLLIDVDGRTKAASGRSLPLINFCPWCGAEQGGITDAG